MLNFGLRLRIARERKGLLQMQAAEKLHISKQAISRYETNASAPGPEIIQSMAELYGVSCDYFMGLTENLNIKPGVHYNDGLSEDEREVIRLFQRSDPQTKAAMLQLLRSLEAHQPPQGAD